MWLVVRVSLELLFPAAVGVWRKDSIELASLGSPGYAVGLRGWIPTNHSKSVVKVLDKANEDHFDAQAIFPLVWILLNHTLGS